MGRSDARMGHHLATTRAQLRLVAADPLRAAVVGRAPSRPHRGRGKGEGRPMRTESRIFLGVTSFFVVIGTLYWFLSYEDAGAVMLAASACLGLLAGGYLFLQSRRFPLRPEDRE